jgi:hypothetical protein
MADRAKWTFMVYMAGNNNLSDAAGTDLVEMQKVGSSDEVAVLAFMKQFGTNTAYRIHVGKGEDLEREDVGDVDSGDPQTVIDFVRWAVQKAPAERYALVLWNHGSGWSADDLDQLYSQPRGGEALLPHEVNRLSVQGIARAMFTGTVTTVLAQPTARARAICSDDGTGHSLDTIELRRVIELTKEAIGKDLDLLGMDACLMSTLEVAYEVRDLATVIAGSEELEPGAGWCYDQILGELAGDPSLDAAALGKVIVERYIDSYRDLQSVWPVTQAAVSTAQVEAFSKTVDALAGALSADIAQSWPKVLTAQSNAVAFERQLVDLKTVCENLLASDPSGGVRDAAQGVLDALQPGGYVIAEGHLGPEVEGVGGVTAYLPAPTDPITEYYADLAFAKELGWNEFLQAYQGAVRGR